MANQDRVSEEDLRRLCEFLYRRTGLILGEAKRYFIERRAADRIAATRAADFASYFTRLRGDVDGEIEQLINAFTVNETYFYREDHQLRCLTTDLLRERVRQRNRREPIRIWSVPCSTGEEPYSIAIWLLENWPEVDAYEIEIVGSDIDTHVLEAARLGDYGKRALMRLSPQLIERYFVVPAPERWRILDDLRQSVQFTTVNVVDPAQTRPHGQFDIIFCRNVLIYFDDASRRHAAENLYENLMPGGFICLGHSESMSRISPLFSVRRFADAIVYQRPQGEKGVIVVGSMAQRILVVDDAGLVRRYYRDILSGAGYELAEAMNGIEGLERLLEQTADLVIVDINMPRMDGLTFVRTLRSQDSAIAGIATLVISTESGEQDRAAARAAGANFYLVKPVDRDVLLEHVGLMCGPPHG